MSTPLRRVIDENGVYITTVVMTDPQTGEWLKEPHVYTMKEGQQLIDAPKPPSSMVKAQWTGELTGEVWVEIATEEEIEEARRKKEQEREQQGTVAAGPSTTERLDALEGAMLAVITGGVSGV